MTITQTDTNKNDIRSKVKRLVKNWSSADLIVIDMFDLQSILIKNGIIPNDNLVWWGSRSSYTHDFVRKWLDCSLPEKKSYNFFERPDSIIVFFNNCRKKDVLQAVEDLDNAKCFA